MESDCLLKIHYYKSLPSTQTFLIDSLKDASFLPPVSVVAESQSVGYGSRGNNWISDEGNLFFSFAIDKIKLPSDLKLESTSIYLSYVLKSVFEEYGSKVWLKWPNDFYLNDKKIGGTITTIVKDTLVCGIGINIIHAPENFGTFDIKIDKKELLENYFKKLENSISWKQVFSNFKVEFEKSKNFETHLQGDKISISKTTLNEDGSLMYNNERIYSLR